VPISCVGGERASVRYLPSPAVGGLPPPFIGQGGGSLQSCRIVSATCGGMVYDAVE
jgi:hypothetical protein